MVSIVLENILEPFSVFVSSEEIISLVKRLDDKLISALCAHLPFGTDDEPLVIDNDGVVSSDICFLAHNGNGPTLNL